MQILWKNSMKKLVLGYIRCGVAGLLFPLALAAPESFP